MREKYILVHVQSKDLLEQRGLHNYLARKESYSSSHNICLNESTGGASLDFEADDINAQFGAGQVSFKIFFATRSFPRNIVRLK